MSGCPNCFVKVSQLCACLGLVSGLPVLEATMTFLLLHGADLVSLVARTARGCISAWMFERRCGSTL
jgi:hypothetical protein